VGRTETEFSAKRLGAAGRSSSGGIPEMTADQVAEGIVNAVEKQRKAVALRWIDRLLLLANVLVPNLIARQAMKQYRS
jgi:short-subunit dehydrogenase